MCQSSMLRVRDYNLGKERDTERDECQCKWQEQWSRCTQVVWLLWGRTCGPSWMFKRATCLNEDFFRQLTFHLEMWTYTSLASLTITEMYIQIMERGFAYKVVNVFLSFVFNDDFQYCHITNWYKCVYFYWEYILKQHFNTPRCMY